MEPFLAELNASFELHQNNEEIRQVIGGLIDYAHSLIDDQPGAEQIHLDFDSDREDDTYDDDSDNNTDQNQDNRDPSKSKYPYETQLKIYELLNEGKTYKYIRNQYKKIKSDEEIKRIKAYVEQGGTKFRKIGLIDQHVLAMFEAARSRLESLHDSDLVTAALIKAREVGLPDFKACSTWLLSFKKRHRIVSRRVTKIVGQNYQNDEQAVNIRIREFMTKTITLLIRENVPRSMIANGDHTGISIELPSYRTLEVKGSKDVIVEHQKVRSTTHSFTLYPVINCDGELFSSFFVCFYEPQRPARFGQDVAPFERLFCDSSPSGKMTTDIQMKWFRDCFCPSVPSGMVFLLDSWSGYKRIIGDDLISSHLKFIVLPEKTTSKIQPLDRLFNRQLKLFLRTIHEKIRRNHHHINISHRTIIGRILNETHYMFSAPIFKNFLKYSWKMAGLYGLVDILFL